MGETVMDGSHIHKAPARTHDGRPCSLHAPEEDQGRPALCGIAADLFLRIKRIDDLPARFPILPQPRAGIRRLRLR